MNEIIIQEGEFKAGEYGELVIFGQPVNEVVFFDFYPKNIYGEPKEAQHKEKGPPIATHMPVVETPSQSGSGWAPPVSVTDAEEPQADKDAEAEFTPEGLDEAFAEPRIVLYCSNCPQNGWKRVGEFKSHIYTRQGGPMYRFYRIIHPVGCPFEGKLVVVAKSE